MQGMVGVHDCLFIGDNPGGVIRVLFYQVRVEVIQGLAHLFGMLLVYTKDDGFPVSVGFLRENR